MLKKNPINPFVSSVKKEKFTNLAIHWASNDKQEIVKNKEAYTIRAKYACFDNLIIIVGSTPLDLQALRSRESDIAIEDPDNQEFCDYTAIKS